MHPLLQYMRAQVSAWEQQGDPRRHFLHCYSMMSANMIQAIAEHRFYDAAWVKRLMLRFADYYYDALLLYDRQSDQTPAVWKHVHDATRSSRLHILQYLLLGINAHINYDLPLALYDCLCDEWSTADQLTRKCRHDDHERVNDIIAETIDTVQDDLIRPISVALTLADRLMGRMDEWLLAQLIRNWRRDVWNVAVDLEAQDARQRERIRCNQEAGVLKCGRQLTLLKCS